jgi:hypothetical protein
MSIFSPNMRPPPAVVQPGREDGASCRFTKGYLPERPKLQKM